MKKIYALIILLSMTSCLIACEEDALPSSWELDIKTVELNEKEEGFTVVVSLDLSDYSGEDIVKLGVLYGEEDLDVNAAIDKKESILTQSNEYSFVFPSIEENLYGEKLEIRAYLKLDTGETVFTKNKVEFSLYDLATDTQHSFAQYIKASVDGKIISTVSVLVDTTHYQASNEVEGYSVELYTDYNIIRLTIVIEDDYLLEESIELLVNNQVIPNNQWEINGKTVTYTFDDPNWTPAY